MDERAGRVDERDMVAVPSAHREVRTQTIHRGVDADDDRIGERVAPLDDDLVQLDLHDHGVGASRIARALDRLMREREHGTKLLFDDLARPADLQDL